MRNDTRRLATLAMIGAMAYVVMVVGRVPMVMFLKYDPKDVLLVLGGFLYGPAAAAALSALVSFVEMFTVSTTGLIGFVMNVLASCSFACVAAWIYSRRRDFVGAAFGMVAGILTMTAVMLAWNYLLTPLFLGMPRERIAELLWRAILPFNVIKGSLNAFFALLLYKPLVATLVRAGLVSPGDLRSPDRRSVVTMAAFGVVTAVALLLVGR